jgi:hypothetical protein
MVSLFFSMYVQLTLLRPVGTKMREISWRDLGQIGALRSVRGCVLPDAQLFSTDWVITRTTLPVFPLDNV